MEVIERAKKNLKIGPRLKINLAFWSKKINSVAQKQATMDTDAQSTSQ